MADDINKDISNEFRREGIPPPRKEGGAAMYENDDTMFKERVITPEMPVDYVEEKYLDFEGKQQVRIFRLPRYVPTMTLGNLTWREMKALRYLMTNARILERHGYMNPSADIHVKYTDTVVTSQCHQGKLLTFVLTQQYGLKRDEQSFMKTEDPKNKEERESPIGKLWDKMREGQQKKSNDQRYSDF